MRGEVFLSLFDISLSSYMVIYSYPRLVSSAWHFSAWVYGIFQKQLLNPVCLTSVTSLIPNCQECQQALPAFSLLLSSSYILYVPHDRWHAFYHTVLNILECYLWSRSFLGTCFLMIKSMDVPNSLFSAFLISLHCDPSRSENVMCMAPVLWSILWLVLQPNMCQFS